MTSTNRAAEGGTSPEHALTDTPATAAREGTIVRRESRRERRWRRRVERRARAARARSAWVATTVDADLPEQLQGRMPGWASTGRGRILLAGAAVVALLAWAFIFMVIAGL